MQRPGKSARPTLISLGLLAASSAALGVALGARGMAIAIVLAIVWLAWRFDNQSGTYLVLVVLVLIAMAVPAMLLLLMAVTH